MSLNSSRSMAHFTFLPFIHVRSVRALEGELASVEENMAACTDVMSMKDSIIQSLTLQLAELQDGGSGADCGDRKNRSRSADAIVETARDLERLTVPICAAFIVLFLFCVYFCILIVFQLPDWFMPSNVCQIINYISCGE